MASLIHVNNVRKYVVKNGARRLSGDVYRDYVQLLDKGAT